MEPLSGKQFIKNQTERIDVALNRNLTTGQLLGGHIGGRTRCDLFPRNLLCESSQPKVGDAHPTPSVDHHVVRFKVTMKDSLVMCRCQSCA